MTIQPPKTIKEWKVSLEAITDLMGNPYCDHLMFMSLMDKRANVDKLIKELKQQDMQLLQDLQKELITPMENKLQKLTDSDKDVVLKRSIKTKLETLHAIRILVESEAITEEIRKRAVTFVNKAVRDKTFRIADMDAYKEWKSINTALEKAAEID